MKESIKQSCKDFKAYPVAAKAKWEDVTSYSQGDKERVPTCFRTTIGGCAITIVYGHIYLPDGWAFHCRALNFDTHELKVETAFDAAEKAVQIIREKIAKLHDDFLMGKP